MTASPSRQDAIDGMWAGTVARLRAQKGLPALDAADPDRGGPARPAPVDPYASARRRGPQSQGEIDAMWAELAARLNATLPPGAVIPACAMGRGER